MPDLFVQDAAPTPDPSALELYETPARAVWPLLAREDLPLRVLDPCCGRGVIAEVLRHAGHEVVAGDIVDWGYGRQGYTRDFLGVDHLSACAVVMNPPFSQAVRFVEHALDSGADLVCCLQRFAFFESGERERFWTEMPIARVYCFADRLTMWRGDIPLTARRNGSSVSHAWWVFDADHRGPPTLHRIYTREHRHERC